MVERNRNLVYKKGLISQLKSSTNRIEGECIAIACQRLGVTRRDGIAFVALLRPSTTPKGLDSQCNNHGNSL